MKEMSNEVYQRGLAIINFSRIFGTRIIKTRKKLANFFKFQSISIHATRNNRRQATGDRKQFQCLQIVFNNKPRSLVSEFN